MDRAIAPEVIVPTPDAVTYDPQKTLADIALPEGWAWTAADTVPTVVNSGYSALTAVDDVNYDYTGVEGYDAAGHVAVRTVPLTVNRAAQAVTIPTAKELTYNGSAQALVEAGSAGHGAMRYALGANATTAPAESAFAATVPTAVAAGDYYVWYRVVGDDNYEDVAPTSVTVTVDKADVTVTAGPTSMPMPTVTPKPTATPKPIADSDFTLLARMKVSGNSKTALEITWTKVMGVDGYDVFFAKCGKRFKLMKTVKASKARVVRFKGLDKFGSYKGRVRTWKLVEGRKFYIGQASPQVHAVAGNYTNKECNGRSVKLNRSRLTLKVGKSATLKATVKGVKSGKKVVQHIRKVRFYSSDANVATVTKGGKVKAVAKGSCTIYALANNGVRARAKVTVK